MKKYFLAAVAAVTLTGCGSNGKPASNAADNANLKALAGTPSSSATTHSSWSGSPRPSPTRSWSASPTPRSSSGAVKLGGYCSHVGWTARTSSGKAVTCTVKSGHSRARWVLLPSGSQTGSGTVRGGAYCTPEGATARGANGTVYTCTKPSGSSWARWTK